MECVLISKTIVMQKWGDIYGDVDVHVLERRTKVGDPWAIVGVEGWACLPMEAQSRKVPHARNDLERSRRSSNALLTAQGPANSSYAFSFFSALIDLQSLSLTPLVFSSLDCKALAFPVSPRRGDAPPLHIGQHLATLANQHLNRGEMTLSVFCQYRS